MAEIRIREFYRPAPLHRQIYEKIPTIVTSEQLTFRYFLSTYLAIAVVALYLKAIISVPCYQWFTIFKYNSRCI